MVLWFFLWVVLLVVVVERGIELVNFLISKHAEQVAMLGTFSRVFNNSIECVEPWVQIAVKSTILSSTVVSSGIQEWNELLFTVALAAESVLMNSLLFEVGIFVNSFF